MANHATKNKEKKGASPHNDFSSTKNQRVASFQFKDKRPNFAKQLKIQEQLSNSLQAQNSLQFSLAPSNNVIQRTIWTVVKGAWVPDDYNGANWDNVYDKYPVPEEGTVFNDAAYLESESDTEEDTFDWETFKSTPAGIEKAKKIQPFIDLIDHLAGEVKTKTRAGKATSVSGGHLLTEMQSTWKTRLTLENPGAVDTDNVWSAKWTLDDGSYKSSTFFPSSWKKDKLTQELQQSNVEGALLILPSGIRVEKKGGTFYPLL